MNPYDPLRLPVIIGTILVVITQFYLAQRLARHEESPWIRALLGFNVLLVFVLMLLLFVVSMFVD